MSLYVVAARRWHTAAAALVATALLCALAGDTAIPMPDLVTSAAPVQLRYYAPLAVTAAILYCLDRNLGTWETTAARPVSAYDGAMTASVLALMYPVGLVVGMDVPRNLAVCLAVALPLRRWTNSAAGTTGALFLLAITPLVGRATQPGGAPVARWWALTLKPDHDATSHAIGLALAAAALFYCFRPGLPSRGTRTGR